MSIIACMKPVVYVVDDDTSVRQSIGFLLDILDFEVRLLGSAQEFLDSYQPGIPACLILDVRMPGMGGLELQDRLRERELDLPLIFISGHGDIPMAVRAIRKGAIDFLQKPFKDQDLLDCVQKAIALDRQRQRERREELTQMARYDFLTPREREVMRLILDGLTNRLIASSLEISPKTVETHRARVMEKMHASSLAELFQAHSIIERVGARQQKQG